MRDIRRPESFEPLVERLTNRQFSETGEPVFNTIMDLLIFAAAVGFANQHRLEVPVSGKAVPFRVFENNHKDGYVYLIALAASQDSRRIATDNDDDVARTFEEYAAGGLQMIDSWLIEYPMDISGVQPLLSKLQDMIDTSNPSLPNPSPL